MEFSNDYLDLWDNPTSLTTEEIAFFQETVDCVKAALSVDVEITNRDHYREMAGKSKEAHGIIYTTDPKNPAADCFITIDNFFIHECFMEKFHGELNLSFESLEHVICHEIAHRSKWRHGKGHTRLTEELFEKVQAYQKEQPSLDHLIDSANKSRVAEHGICKGPGTRDLGPGKVFSNSYELEND